jgi:hypothetical protein
MEHLPKAINVFYGLFLVYYQMNLLAYTPI